jgi:hypothetical protein
MSCITCPICYRSVRQHEDAFLEPCYHVFCFEVRCPPAIEAQCDGNDVGATTMLLLLV